MSLNKSHNLFVLILFVSLFSSAIWAKEFTSAIHNVNTELNNGWYHLNADLDYKLSPTAEQALKKGIPLTWDIQVKVKHKGMFWDANVREIEITCRIKKDILLDLYHVTKVKEGKAELFSSLKAALNSIAKIRSMQLIKKQSMQAEQHYFIAIKIRFNRETLPIPLRPLSYFDSEWALSSPWVLWPLQD